MKGEKKCRECKCTGNIPARRAICRKCMLERYRYANKGNSMNLSPIANSVMAYKRLRFRKQITKPVKMLRREFPGVYFDKKSENWRVSLSVHGKGKCTHFGTFKNKKDAINKSIEVRKVYPLPTPLSGVRGVYWFKMNSSWMSYYRRDGIRHFLGFFKTVDAAQNALDMHKLEQHKIMLKKKKNPLLGVRE